MHKAFTSSHRAKLTVDGSAGAFRLCTATIGILEMMSRGVCVCGCVGFRLVCSLVHFNVRLQSIRNCQPERAKWRRCAPIKRAPGSQLPATIL